MDQNSRPACQRWLSLSRKPSAARHPATTRDSVKESRERVVAVLDLDNLTDNEAIRFLKLASESVYDTDDMPERLYGVFDEMENNLHP